MYKNLIQIICNKQTVDQKSEAVSLSHIASFQNKEHFYIIIMLFFFDMCENGKMKSMCFLKTILKFQRPPTIQFLKESSVFLNTPKLRKIVIN